MDEGIKFDEGKLDWTLLPLEQLESVIGVLQLGAIKYSKDNWKKVDRSRYEQALMRHVTAYIKASQKGDLTSKNDTESGISHLAHAICNCLFLMYFDDEIKGE